MLFASTSDTGEGGPSILFSEQVRIELDGNTAAYGDLGKDHNGSYTFDDDDETMPPAAGIIAGAEPVVHEGIQVDDTNDPTEPVDMDFWIQSDGHEDEAGPSRKRRSEEDTALELVDTASDSSVASYHSGDTADFEMDHRPWLDRAGVKRDIENLYGIHKEPDGTYDVFRYLVVDRLGEGTFSSVYLARDTYHNLQDNTYWTGKPNVDKSSELYTHRKVKVALKKILVTSSPARVENEISILENLRGCRHVSPLITAFRDQDQVIIVLPFHQSDDFRYFYKLMDPPKISQYMSSLLRALKDIHGRGIIHRDVKPANFLFDYESGQGVLVDFGLAERYQPPKRSVCQHHPATREKPHGGRTVTGDTTAVEHAVYDARKRAKAGEGRVGFRQEDSRPAVKTNRAGTRGFRAPEVLLKCPDQTVAIDIWSAGIILLSLLTHKFPVFNSSDDVEALMEVAAIFGRTAMERCAMLHNRTIITNVPTVDNIPDSLSNLILGMNPNLYTPHQPHATPEQAEAHIDQVDRLLDLCARLLRLDATSRLTADEALRHGAIDADEPPLLYLDPTEGKCGDLHVWTEDGKHRARFGDALEDMNFGQGLPLSRDSLCPEHEHWQQRSGVNPLGAAFGCELDKDYHLRTGFHVLDEYSNWDRVV